ncbi:uncharacterized protein [Rutidosis leptorrhynchoides]|uniref:uncharacterized protein n=1 Tax=Rutidosis leptorrhynchoides TaxID=125765 RepID=UPI003A99E7E7
MEIDTKNGSKIQLKNPLETIEFGRGLGFKSTDLTVSRRHISFKLNESQTGVCFKVNGKNPVWVRDGSNDEIRVYRSSETGEINSGDSICLSSKSPVWFILNKIDENRNESKGEIEYDDVFAETSGIDYGDIETVDSSIIDPVKEFKFVVMGREFDSYSKKVIRDIRNWDWFLEEAKEESDEDSEREAKKGKRRKRKKGDNNDDDVWTGESEEDVEMIKKLKNSQKPKYSTRSKKQEKNKKGASTSKNVKDNTKKNAMDDDEEDDDDENDETLGGFIVDDEEDMGELNDEDDEEEEFEDDDDE